MRALEQPAVKCEGRTYRILQANEPHMAKGLADSIAFRTNQIQRAKGRDRESQLHDFLIARSEIYCRMYGGVFSAKDRFDVVADIACFEMGEEISVYVESRRVILSGTASANQQSTERGENEVDLRGNKIFRFLDLEEEIEPSQAKAEIDGCVLEIHLPKMISGRRAAQGRLRSKQEA
jgi:HSP20 family molecular chaperone IbpA